MERCIFICSFIFQLGKTKKCKQKAKNVRKQVRKKLHQQILSGEIDIGKGIVEKEYQKAAISKTGEVTIKTFKVEGRKHPLPSIRKKVYETKQ